MGAANHGGAPDAEMLINHTGGLIPQEVKQAIAIDLSEKVSGTGRILSTITFEKQDRVAIVGGVFNQDFIEELLF